MSELSRITNHLFNELRLQLYLGRRYWFESIFGFLIIVALFIGLLLTVVTTADSNFTSGKLDGLLVGFVLWMFATTAYGSSSHDITDETRARTIEQLCVAPLRLSTLLACRALVRLLGGSIFLLFALVTLSMATSGRIGQGVPGTIAIALLSAPSLVGVGYLMAGLVLIVKRADLAQALAYPCLIALVAIPVDISNWLALLPYSLGASAARDHMSGGTPTISTLFFVGSNSLIWFLGGVYSFRALEHAAKKRGLLGHM
jgi:ABC-2 type transport system permease protein